MSDLARELNERWITPTEGEKGEHAKLEIYEGGPDGDYCPERELTDEEYDDLGLHRGEPRWVKEFYPNFNGICEGFRLHCGVTYCPERREWFSDSELREMTETE